LYSRLFTSDVLGNEFTPDLRYRSSQASAAATTMTAKLTVFDRDDRAACCGGIVLI
jgi:hypothetical protein